MKQGSEEWFAARLGRATASRFADVMSTLKSGAESSERRNYRAQLVCERLTGKKAESFSNRAMLVGTEREPDARLMYEAETGALVQSAEFMPISGLMAGASPDGLIGTDGALEIKCPQQAAHMTYLRLPDGKAPAEYVAQVQGQLWITGRAWADFVSYNPDFPDELQLVIRRVPRDNEYISKLSVAITSFLETVDAEEAEMRALMKLKS